MSEIEPPYRAQLAENHVSVVDESGKVVLRCGDAANAEQYAALLNQAFARGYKAGYHAAKQV